MNKYNLAFGILYTALCLMNLFAVSLAIYAVSLFGILFNGALAIWMGWEAVYKFRHLRNNNEFLQETSRTRATVSGRHDRGGTS